MTILESSEKREAVFSTMIRIAMDALIVIDIDGVVHAWNPQAEIIFGWKQDEVVEKPLDHFIQFRQSDNDNTNNATFSFLQVLDQRIEVSVTNRHGSVLAVELTVTPVRLDDIKLFVACIRDLTDIKKAEQRLQTALDPYKRLMDSSPDVICTIDDAGIFVQVSKASERIWGYPPEELIGRPYIDLVHPADRSITVMEQQALKTSTLNLHFENRYLHKNGQVVDVVWSTKWSANDRTYYCVARDGTETKKAASALAERDKWCQSLFEHHPDGVFAFDLNGHLLSANAAFCVMTGYSREELADIGFQQLVAPESVAMVEEHFYAATQGKASSFEAIGVRNDDGRYDAQVMALPIIVNDQITGLHGIARDITNSKNYERRIQYLATYDSITGLPNRNLLNDRIQHAIDQAARQGHLVGILFLDLNRFKIINDSLGHDKGDLLLRIVGDRLSQCVRQADTVARVGGDEFVVVLENVSSAERVIEIARELLTEIEKPVRLDSHDFTVSCSIGCSLYPKDGHDAVTLLRNADLAMYEAKPAQGGAYRLFKADMNERVKARLLHEHQLRHALEREELVVYYQPRIHIASNRIVGVEALVRWQHPDRGLVPPNEFIPLAEEVGLINELGEWVLKTACHQLRSWQVAGLPPLKVSVNLSPFQLASDSTIIHAVKDTLLDSGLGAEWLELEITETGLMENVESTLVKLFEIRDAGVSISIDDFGTGYSSLSYLRRLPANTLKIDQSFIRDMADSKDDAAIVSATIALAHTMQMKVVAEGVTTAEQIRFLQEYECDEVQGYWYSPALPAHELAILLHAGGYMNVSAIRH